MNLHVAMWRHVSRYEQSPSEGSWLGFGFGLGLGLRLGLGLGLGLGLTLTLTLPDPDRVRLDDAPEVDLVAARAEARLLRALLLGAVAAELLEPRAWSGLGLGLGLRLRLRLRLALGLGLGLALG